MAKKIIPIGELIIVKPIETETVTTDGGMVVTERTNDRGEVVAVSEYLKDIYKKGDIVIYPKTAGTGIYYDKENCVWLNGREHPQGDVWGIEK